MRALCSVALVAVLFVVASAGAQHQRRKDGGTRCEKLEAEAAEQLLAEQYPAMVRTAEAHETLCNSTMSQYLVGLALAQLVESGLGGVAELVEWRERSLRALEVAATAGGELPVELRMRAYEWRRHLQETAATGGVVPYVEPGATSEMLPAPEPVEVAHHAPPPLAFPGPPWGPVVLWVAGFVVVGTGVGLAIDAEATLDDIGELRRGGWALGSEVDVHDVADGALAQRDWAVALLVTGGLSIAGGVVWYTALEPDGGWKWALGPGTIQWRGRF